MIAQRAETAPATINAMMAPIVDALNAAFGDRLLSFYLYGSAAHGWQRSPRRYETGFGY
ncbi:MAG: hypothetical protein ACR5LF_06960 [Symbiopectobacterium sp.]